MKPRIFIKSLTVSTAIAAILAVGTPGISQTIDNSTATRVVTPQGVAITTHVIRLSDMPAIGDPLGNSPVTPNYDAGPAVTRQPYPENCSEDRCIRAQQRQLGSTTWQQDRASGLHKSGS